MKKNTLTNQTLVAAAGLAICVSAQGAWSFTQNPTPVLVAANQTVLLGSTTVMGAATIFTYSFGYDEPINDSSWASDMRIDISLTPTSSGITNTLSIGGFGAPGDFTPSYDGPASDAPGIYGGIIDVSSFGLSGTGLLEITITNDWAGDPNPNQIGGFAGTALLPVNHPFTATIEGFTVIPTPGALCIFGVAGLAALRRRR